MLRRDVPVAVFGVLRCLMLWGYAARPLAASNGQNWYLVYRPENEGPPDAAVAALPPNVPAPVQGKVVFLTYPVAWLFHSNFWRLNLGSLVGLVSSSVKAATRPCVQKSK